MPTYMVAWLALVLAAYTGYLGLVPLLRRRPVRITRPMHVAMVAVALAPGLAYLVFGWVGGVVAVSIPTTLAGTLAVVGLVAMTVAWRGLHEFHGTTAETFRDAWRAALDQLGHTYDVRVGGSGRVERVVLIGHPDRVEFQLRQGTLRGFGAAGRSAAAEVADGIDRYFATHHVPVDRTGSGVAVTAAVALLVLALFALGAAL